MLDEYAKEQYEVASTLLDDINGEDIRELLLKVTIENARVNYFKTTQMNNVVDESDNLILERLAKSFVN